MTNPDDPAFIDSIGVGFKNGLTKREYFAAMAMQGLLAGDHSVLEFKNEREARIAAAERLERIGWASLRFADALIAELNKEPK